MGQVSSPAQRRTNISVSPILTTFLSLRYITGSVGNWKGWPREWHYPVTVESPHRWSHVLSSRATTFQLRHKFLSVWNNNQIVARLFEPCHHRGGDSTVILKQPLVEHLVLLVLFCHPQSSASAEVGKLFMALHPSWWTSLDIHCRL